MFIDNPQDIRNMALITLKYRLKLEVLGMKCRGPSALSQVQKVMGVKVGSRKKALPMYEDWLAANVPGYSNE